MRAMQGGSKPHCPAHLYSCSLVGRNACYLRAVRIRRWGRGRLEWRHIPSPAEFKNSNDESSGVSEVACNTEDYRKAWVTAAFASVIRRRFRGLDHSRAVGGEINHILYFEVVHYVIDG